MKPYQHLRRIGACGPAVEAMKEAPTWEKVISMNKDPEWSMWLIEKLKLLDNKELRLLACRFVRKTPLADGRRVWDLLTDERSREAVRVAERYANGRASASELAAARAAAWAAAGYAAGDAAGNAAGAAAGDAARGAAGDAAGDAAGAAAGDAAGAAAGAAARAAAGAAAGAAARAAAGDAAGAAAWAYQAKYISRKYGKRIADTLNSKYPIK